MQIVCSKCHTKYSLPDEKVAGKILKVKCKKCGNILVIKGTKQTLEKKKREHRERITSSRARSVLRKAFEEDSGPLPDEEFEHVERTQIAMMPKLEDFASDEEWYLADSRGQFGPMSFQELIARLKRGEPEPDAVVWREGFEDWRAIEEVPELKPHYKPAPPPRKDKEKEESAPINKENHNKDVAVPNIQQPVFTAPVYPATESQIITQTPIKSWQNKLLPFLIGGIVAGIVAFFIAKSLIKPQVKVVERVVEKVAPLPQGTNTKKSNDNNELEEYEIALDDTKNDKNKKVEPSKKKVYRKKSSVHKSVNIKEVEPTENKPQGRSKNILDAIVSRGKPRLLRCYSQTKRKGLAVMMDKKISFKILIPPNGIPKNVSFIGKLPPFTKACFEKSIKHWKFPPSGKTDVYHFTMIFQ